jgi:MraZ protein
MWGAVFSGSHPLTIDDKGRLAIPARLRQQLAEDHGLQVYITRAYQPCIEIYPVAEFRRVVEQIEAVQDGVKADLLKQVFIGNAFEAEVDKQGRVLLPQVLRQYARLDSAAVLVGQNRRMDLWSESLWQVRFGEGSAEDLAGAFALIKR